ncbi:MAG: matrixin family metalloprotease [Pyrinomonadaceae bacterium]
MWIGRLSTNPNYPQWAEFVFMAGTFRNKIALLAVFLLQGALIISAASEPLSPQGKRWPKGPIRISISTSLRENLALVPADSVTRSLFNALAKWEAVADVEFEVVWSDAAAVSPKGNSGDGVSLITIAPVAENLLLFSNGKSDAAAVTRLYRNKQNQITEADIVLNPATQFSVDGAFGTFDLEQVFTHEVGHLLGLEHSMIRTSVMFEELSKNGYLTDERSDALTAADVGNIRSLYGSRGTGSDDCSQLSGRVLGRNLRGATIAAHDTRTGALITSARTSNNGSYTFGCVPQGRFDLIASADSTDKNRSYIFLQTVTLNSKIVEVLSRQYAPVELDFDIFAMGRNNLISNGPVRVASGETFRAVIAGRNIAEAALKFGSSSPQIAIRILGNVSSEFASDNQVVRVEIEAGKSLTPGEYSLYAEDGRGQRRYIFGLFRVN